LKDPGVASKLQTEIKQSKPFAGIEHEALLNIQRTSSFVVHTLQQLLRRHGLTESQYNVLRIMRGAGPDGLRCTEIGERMIARDPDVTRLVERLQRSRLVERRRDAKDRRVIYSRITDQGLKILEELDPEVDATSKAMFSHMTAEKLGVLIQLLEDVREGSGCCTG
jgi:DNA-binding MarR family transcriptional regulator